MDFQKTTARPQVGERWRRTVVGETQDVAETTIREGEVTAVQVTATGAMLVRLGHGRSCDFDRNTWERIDTPEQTPDVALDPAVFNVDLGIGVSTFDREAENRRWNRNTALAHAVTLGAAHRLGYGDVVKAAEAFTEFLGGGA